MTQTIQSSIPGDLLTVEEVASSLRVSKMTIYRLIKTGELRAIRVGRSFRVRSKDVEAKFNADAASLISSAAETSDS